MSDQERRIARIKVSFAKDTVYGAALLVIFSSLGWSQWVPSVIHVASAVCLFGNLLYDEGTIKKTDEPLGRTSASLYLVASGATLLSDLIILLMTSCSLSQCCPSGSRRPVFMPIDSSDLCGGGSRRLDNEFIASATIATVLFGIVVGVSRVMLVLGARKGEDTAWWVPPLMYLLIRIWIMTWSSGTAALFLGVGAVASYIGLTIILINSGRYKGEETALRLRMKRIASGLPLLASTLDIIALAVVGAGSGPKEMRVPFIIMQTLALLLAIWGGFVVWKKTRRTETPNPSGAVETAYKYGRYGGADPLGIRRMQL